MHPITCAMQSDDGKGVCELCVVKLTVSIMGTGEQETHEIHVYPVL